MRIVLDTNIFVSSLISDKGNPALIVRWWLEGAFDVLVSQPIIDELLRVTAYERILQKYAKVAENRPEFTALLSEQAIWVDPGHELDVIAADDSDNRYLECAITGLAQYIVTVDDHLLDLGDYLGIVIVTPAAFVTPWSASRA